MCRSRLAGIAIALQLGASSCQHAGHPTTARAARAPSASLSTRDGKNPSTAVQTQETTEERESRLVQALDAADEKALRDECSLYVLNDSDLPACTQRERAKAAAHTLDAADEKALRDECSLSLARAEDNFTVSELAACIRRERETWKSLHRLSTTYHPDSTPAAEPAPTWEERERKRNEEQAARDARFSQVEADSRKLAPLMREARVRELLGEPESTELKQFGWRTKSPWKGLIWHYPGGLSVVFESRASGWVVNGWQRGGLGL